ncbi:MAG: zinc finger-like domain-containing protein [Candidatus Aureabacteria bacterium]|nr:zinc finger-like domain-containing protein [Candidatus Auribacterota bacterium]
MKKNRKIRKKSSLFSERGVALIIVLSVLTLLIVMALGMSASMMYEEKAARDFSHGMIARLAADTCFMRAIHDLRQEALSNYMDTSAEAWFYNSQTAPSFDISWGDAANNNASLVIQGDTYVCDVSLRVIDCASCIYINDVASTTEGRLARIRILHNLFSILGIVSDTGTNVYDEMANNGPYDSFEDLVARTNLTDTDLGTFCTDVAGANNGTGSDTIELIDCITVFSYRDPNTIDGSDTTTADLTPAYSSDPRAPVNVNTANAVVLQALIRGLRADNCCPKCGGDGKISYQVWPNVSHIVCNACNGTGDLVITNTEAGYLAQWLVANRPFTSYQDLYTRLRTASVNNSTNGTGAANPVGERDADVIMANFNPNPGFNPGCRDYAWGLANGYVSKCRDIRGGVAAYGDGTQPGLYNSTTEFCFNSGGWHLVDSQAKVMNTQRTMLFASKRIQSYVKLFDKFIHTTQDQFHNANPLDLAANPGTFNRTLDYPEPTPTTVSGYTTGFSAVSAAPYDGYIMRDFIRYTQPNSGEHLLIQFDKDGLEANSFGASAGFPVRMENITVGPLADPANPGDVLREGILVTKRERQLLSYPCVDNLNRKTASIQIWYKNLFHEFDNHNYGWNNFTSSIGSADLEKTILWITEQFYGRRYLPYFNNKGIWTDNGSNVYWYWCDKALYYTPLSSPPFTTNFVSQPTNPPIAGFNSSGWGTGRNMYQIWTYNITGSSQVLAINSLGCGSLSGGASGAWEWMRLTSQGFQHSAGNPRKKGEWTEVATTFDDGGLGYLNPADPAYDVNLHYPPSDMHDKADWVHTGVSPEAGRIGRNLPSFVGDTHPAQGTWEKKVYIDATEITAMHWGFAGRGFMQFDKFDDSINPNVDYDSHIVFGAQYETYPYGSAGIRRKSYAEGIISGVRVWNSLKDNANILIDYNQGRYYFLGMPDYISPLVCRKEANDQWGCVFWTQYQPLGVSSNLRLRFSSDRTSWSGFYSNPSGGSISSLVLGDDFFYRLYFPDRTASAPLVNTSVFDDFRVTCIHDTQMFNYRELQ